jgi:putative ABC transport system permease protein
MIKLLFKQIWKERRQNCWLLLELTVVFFFLLLMTDFLWVKLKNYMEPPGFDADHTYVLNLKELEDIAPEYVDPGQITQTPVEELYSIAERIRLYPDIAHISISVYSSPYSMGGYWNMLMKEDSLFTPTIRCRQVTPSYFDVFHIRTADGKPIRIEETGYNQIILTKDMAELFYGDAAQATGKEVYLEGENKPRRISSVCNLIKRQDFYPYEGAWFEILSASGLENWVENNSITRVDLCVRVKPGTDRHFRDNFIPEMGARLKENNLYVSSVVSSDKLKDSVVGKMIREDILPMAYVMGFVLVTVFMGVFGAFWLRTRQHRSDIGIRMAMGADKGAIWYSILAESLCLMVLAILPAFLVYINLLKADILDTGRLPFTAGRTLIALFSALLIMITVIVGGISWPAGKAASLHPVDALRDE